MKTIMTALAITVLPGFALAMGCNYDKHQEASISCAQGQTWDADSQTCVNIAS